jgi:hypothetical protein
MVTPAGGVTVPNDDLLALAASMTPADGYVVPVGPSVVKVYVQKSVFILPMPAVYV